jgi:hypothetical protein
MMAASFNSSRRPLQRCADLIILNFLGRHPSSLWAEALLVQKNERVALEIKIIKYRALARQAPDVETTQRINGLIAELEQNLREIAE